MTIKEHNKNILTKQHDDPVENYLKNIIQRYFEIEEEFSQSTKEAIIIQAYTRLKEMINAYASKFVICVNERSGAINLFIKDLGGEPKFEKNSAYNKNFCDIEDSINKALWNNTTDIYNHFGKEQEQHIVEGNDDRLSDARIPIAHVHVLDDIPGLRTILEKNNLINDGFHLHNNTNLLNILIYTGTQTSIDLILFENLIEKVDESVKRLKETDNYFINMAKRYIYQLQDLFVYIYKKLTYIDEHVDEWLSELLIKTNKNTDSKTIAFQTYITNLLYQYLTKEEKDKLEKTLKRAITLVQDGTINFNDRFRLLDFKKTLKNEINFASFKLKYGSTNIALLETNSKKITGQVLDNFYDSKINNGAIKLFLEYTLNGISYRDPLPHIYQVNDSQHDAILVYGNSDSDNNINIYAKRLSYLPNYICNPILLNVIVTDYENNYSTGSLILDNETTSSVSNNQPQDNNTIQSFDQTHLDVNGINIDFTVSGGYVENNGIYTYAPITLNWTSNNHSYQIFKKTDTDWIPLLNSEVFSSDEEISIKNLYDNGYVYSIKPNDENLLTIQTDKEYYWSYQDGYLMYRRNESHAGLILTKEKYETYRHRVTFTCYIDYDDPNWFQNNDAIATVISAVKIDGVLHTLSLVVWRQISSSSTSNPKNDCRIVFDWATDRQQYLTTFSHNGTAGENWSENIKINFDIRKDKNNLYIYTSDFYNTIDGLEEYTYDINPDPSVTMSFSNIQSQTGIDFTDGMVGYGCCNQQGATFIGINLNCYDNKSINQYTDEQRNYIQPCIPNITGKCLSSYINTDTYEFDIEYSDTYKKAEYKYVILNDLDWSTINSNNVDEYYNSIPLYESNPIFVTIFSNIKNIEYNIKGANNFVVVSETNGLNSKHIELQINKQILDDKLIFNHFEKQSEYFYGNNYEYNNEYLDNLNNFNCKHIEYNYNNKFIYEDGSEVDDTFYDYIKSLSLIYDYNSYNIDNYSGLNEYVIEYDYLSVRDFLPNAKVYYQLFKVPGKGDFGL